MDHVCGTEPIVLSSSSIIMIYQHITVTQYEQFTNSIVLATKMFANEYGLTYRKFICWRLVAFVLPDLWHCIALITFQLYWGNPTIIPKLTRHQQTKKIIKNTTNSLNVNLSLAEKTQSFPLITVVNILLISDAWYLGRGNDTTSFTQT